MPSRIWRIDYRLRCGDPACPDLNVDKVFSVWANSDGILTVPRGMLCAGCGSPLYPKETKELRT